MTFEQRNGISYFFIPGRCSVRGTQGLWNPVLKWLLSTSGSLNPHQNPGERRKTQNHPLRGRGLLIKWCRTDTAKPNPSCALLDGVPDFRPLLRAGQPVLSRLPASRRRVLGTRWLTDSFTNHWLYYRGSEAPSRSLVPRARCGFCASTSACWRHGPGTRGGSGTARVAYQAWSQVPPCWALPSAR